MTTFPSDRRVIKAEALRLLFADANDPDSISAEAWLDQDLVFSIMIEANGAKTIWFAEREYETPGLLELLLRCDKELSAWDANLRAPGQIWEHEAKA